MREQLKTKPEQTPKQTAIEVLNFLAADLQISSPTTQDQLLGFLKANQVTNLLKAIIEVHGDVARPQNSNFITYPSIVAGQLTAPHTQEPDYFFATIYPAKLDKPAIIGLYAKGAEPFGLNLPIDDCGNLEEDYFLNSAYAQQAGSSALALQAGAIRLAAALELADINVINQDQDLQLAAA